MLPTTLVAIFDDGKGKTTEETLPISHAPEDLEEGKEFDLMTGPAHWKGPLKITNKRYQLQDKHGWVQVLTVEKVEVPEEE